MDSGIDLVQEPPTCCVGAWECQQNVVSRNLVNFGSAEDRLIFAVLAVQVVNSRPRFSRSFEFGETHAHNPGPHRRAHGCLIWVTRMRNAAEMTHELAGVAGDVMAAARRLGFRRKLDTHPVESLDEPNLAIGAIGIAFLELGGLPTAEQQDALLTALQSRTGQSPKDAEETLILGRWLVTESNGPSQAIPRLARRLAKIDRAGSFTPLMAVLDDVAQAGRSDGVSDKQRDALTEIAQAFRLT